MLSYPDKLQIIRPSLPPQQHAYRNKYYKNWGNLNPIKFGRLSGIPLLILPPCKDRLLQRQSDEKVFSIICFIFFICYIAIKTNSYWWISIGLCLVACCCYCWGCASGHGIASSGVPILNEDSFRHFKGYCQPCRMFIGQIGQKMRDSQQLNQDNQKKEIVKEHCKFCKICYYQSYYHSAVLGICITKQNYFNFILFYSATFAALFSLFIVIFFF